MWLVQCTTSVMAQLGGQQKAYVFWHLSVWLPARASDQRALLMQMYQPVPAFPGDLCLGWNLSGALRCLRMLLLPVLADFLPWVPHLSVDLHHFVHAQRPGPRQQAQNLQAIHGGQHSVCTHCNQTKPRQTEYTMANKKWWGYLLWQLVTDIVSDHLGALA